MPIVQFQSINMRWEDFSWKVWCACWGRNITTVFIALLLDKYLMKLHYCSNTLFFLDIFMVGNLIVFVFILYCILELWHVLNICVCLLDTFQKVCMYCIFVFAYCHFEQAKYYANCTRPKKKQKKETEINLGCRLKMNLCKANSFVLSVLFHLPHPLMIRWFWWTCIQVADTGDCQWAYI